MAASNPLVSAPVLSQKQRRAAQRKERRKRKRQALAQARQCGLNNEPDCGHEDEEEINDEDEDGEAAEAERLRLHEQWMDRERRAQDEFRMKCEREEAARQRKEEEERMIKEEWEEQQRREKEVKEQKQQEKRDREEAVQKMLDEAENQLDKTGPWMNPEAPATEKSENFGTERDAANCPFFLKTGSCRFGDRCSRKHVYPTSSPTLLIRSMFLTFGMEESRRDDYDIDACLEHSEEELHESFLDFYHDVLPEFKSIGKVIQFKVSCNYEPHLRGNVYVQFDTEEQCRDALVRFNGRWYAGRQLHCEICPVTRWKNAICGLFDRHRCPKGKHCNFLHVFRNPGNEFWEADRDLHMSPDRSVRTSRRDRDGWYSERHSERSWRQRHGSRSPLRSERSHRLEDDRSRDRTEDRWTSRSRHSDRRTERSYLSRNGDRSRSRSRDRNRSRDKYRDRNEDRERGKDAQRKRSRSTETEKSRKSKEKRSRKTSNDESNTRHRHKHKKNKKKSKKSKKKKSRLSEDMTSSGESDDEKSDKETEVRKESDKETKKEMKKCLTPVVGEETDESEPSLKTRAIASETFCSDVKPEPSDS